MPSKKKKPDNFLKKFEFYKLLGYFGANLLFCYNCFYSIKLLFFLSLKKRLTLFYHHYDRDILFENNKANKHFSLERFDILFRPYNSEKFFILSLR